MAGTGRTSSDVTVIFHRQQSNRGLFASGPLALSMMFQPSAQISIVRHLLSQRSNICVCRRSSNSDPACDPTHKQTSCSSQAYSSLASITARAVSHRLRTRSGKSRIRQGRCHDATALSRPRLDVPRVNAGAQLARKVGLAVRVAKLVQEIVLEVAEKALQEARRAQPERFLRRRRRSLDARSSRTEKLTNALGSTRVGMDGHSPGDRTCCRMAICTLAAPTLLAINSVFWPSIPARSSSHSNTFFRSNFSVTAGGGGIPNLSRQDPGGTSLNPSASSEMTSPTSRRS